MLHSSSDSLCNLKGCWLLPQTADAEAQPEGLSENESKPILVWGDPPRERRAKN